MIDIRKSNINMYDFISTTRTEEWKKYRKGEGTVDWLNRISIPSDCISKFQWREDNEYWLDDSFKISFVVLSFLRQNKVKIEDFEDMCGFDLDLSGSYDWKLSEIKKLELLINNKLL